MHSIELQFPVQGKEISSDHGYALFGAVARLIPEAHAAEWPVRLGPIRGTYRGEGKLQLQSHSRLRLRLGVDQLSQVMVLAGKRLELDGDAIRLGVPQVFSLVAAPTLVARMVVIKASSRDREQQKRYLEPAAFLEGAHKQLANLGITQASVSIPLVAEGVHAGKPRRRVMTIRGKKIVGFPLIVEGITAEESVKLQEHGLGGRGKMGCGFFGPLRG